MATWIISGSNPSIDSRWGVFSKLKKNRLVPAGLKFQLRKKSIRFVFVQPCTDQCCNRPSVSPLISIQSDLFHKKFVLVQIERILIELKPLCIPSMNLVQTIPMFSQHEKAVFTNILQLTKGIGFIIYYIMCKIGT